MSLPGPYPGRVVRYGFVWGSEADRGVEESAKDRPCAIIVTTRRVPEGALTTLLAPITHSPPLDPTTSLEIPADICRKLRLDDGRHWVRIDEFNRFEWPGFDLRPKPGTQADYVYGDLPKPFFEKLKSLILARANRKAKSRIMSRD